MGNLNMDKRTINDNFKDNGTIVIIHSAFLNSKILQDFACELSKLYEKQIFILDLPGHIEGMGEGEYSAAGYAQKVKEYLNEHKASGEISKDDIHIIGWSMGGSIGLQLALDKYQGVTMLTMLSSSSNWTFPDIPKEVFLETLTSVISAEIGEKNRARLMDSISGMLAPIDTCMCDLKTLQTFDVLDSLESLEMPVQLIAGSVDTISPLADQMVMFEKIPDISIMIISNMGHFLPLERPKDVAYMVKAWTSER
ncbi:Pimeloyl-ACP methyl ester carboxylesterase [Peptoclostridium litorale DSM 5388]|uniref:AB hydrolase-1 domain-containing protein n=1 Tax=Peptoclostridium litorale DSM 5388 TaxID=1121324 RepID=A0A069RI23_PEPLI|nr:alpha/beta hydrolase [Peptoclostridium litorale]KDR95805.1 hypothetical protein CLIT_10c05330 [Peptoclostridium litorale DSM 5388]SIO20963.1 Pimeloyl-ACP methyl ester carboxylesterase [Peptoclostridium litorale DSM 5388]